MATSEIKLALGSRGRNKAELAFNILIKILQLNVNILTTKLYSTQCY